MRTLFRPLVRRGYHEGLPIPVPYSRSMTYENRCKALDFAAPRGYVVSYWTTRGKYHISKPAR